MLKLAIEAQLPLVAAHTRDTLNLPSVLMEITKKKPTPWTPQAKAEAGVLYYYLFDKKIEVNWMTVYSMMVGKESTLLVVNPPKIDEPMFDAGEIPVPRSLMMSFMKAVVTSEAKATELLRGLGGCTVKEAAELARLTMARDNSLTVGGLMETRKSSFQASRGLTQVDVKQTFYQPPAQLSTWLAAERKFFLTGTDLRLIPRGLLMDGPPGTGKTAASKWLAEQLGVPLYRVDVGGAKSKWMGGSEENMLLSLARVDAEEPCVVLIDEVEKVFSKENHDVSGTTSTMMSQLLWWLAEHKSRVLTVMTTNKAAALPKELYREGRIDKVLWFDGLEWEAATDFVKAVLGTFPKVKWVDKDLDAIKNRAFEGDAKKTQPMRASQAKLTEAVYTFVKSTLT